MIIFPIIIYIIQKNNFEYYSVYGRTQDEISKWLRNQKWYSTFREYAEKENDPGEYSAIIHGARGVDTISEAFSWIDTKEGSAYWGDIEYKFLKWYFGQYINLNLVE